MDWQATNNENDGTWHVPSDWSRRPTRASFSFQGRSVPLETMVHLANVLGVRPWFCMHHASPASWVSAAAAIVGGSLRADLTPILEFSNEAWSAATPQDRAMAAAGAAAGTTAARAHAVAAAAMLAAWDRGAPARARTFVLSTFTVNSWYSNKMFAATALCAAFPSPATVSPACAEGSTSFPVWHAAAALGVSAYLDCGGIGGDDASAAAAAASSVDAILDTCVISVAGASTQWAAQAAAAAAAAAGGVVPALPLAVYEGGPGLVEYASMANGYETAGLTALLIAAHRSPRMERLSRRCLDRADDGGPVHALQLGGVAIKIWLLGFDRVHGAAAHAGAQGARALRVYQSARREPLARWLPEPRGN
jgi:hypothetical protein